MARPEYYRYVSAQELAHIRTSRTVRSRSEVTYFTPDRYDDPNLAQQRLAMPHVPEYRVGPIAADRMPDFDVVPLQPVGFVDPSRPGGGVEAATSGEVRLFGFYEFRSTRYL